MTISYTGPRYNTIVIDPPWPITMITGGDKWKRRHKSATSLNYKTMLLSEIEDFPLHKFCNHGAHVYLWTTNKFLSESFHILKMWLIKFHLTLVGYKPSGVTGKGYVYGTEFVLLGFAGQPMLPFKKYGELNHFKMICKAGQHSRKPDVFYEKVEAMSPGPYIDIFSRKNRSGWDAWGDEIGKFDTPVG